MGVAVANLLPSLASLLEERVVEFEKALSQLKKTDPDYPKKVMEFIPLFEKDVINATTYNEMSIADLKDRIPKEEKKLQEMKAEYDLRDGELATLKLQVAALENGSPPPEATKPKIDALQKQVISGFDQLREKANAMNAARRPYDFMMSALLAKTKLDLQSLEQKKSDEGGQVTT